MIAPGGRDGVVRMRKSNRKVSRRRCHWPLVGACGLVVLSAAVAADAGDLGYPSVAAARAALPPWPADACEPGTQLCMVVDPDGSSVWSFTAAGHPAHPAVVRRRILLDDGQVRVQSVGLGEGDPVAFERLMDAFAVLDRALQEELNQGSVRGASE